MSSGNKSGTVVLFTLMAVICGWFYATPYIALYQFRKVVEARDTVAISKHINFPALRESLKSGLASESGKQSAGDSNPLKALKSALAGAVTDQMLESLVTPEGIAAMMNGEMVLWIVIKPPEALAA